MICRPLALGLALALAVGCTIEDPGLVATLEVRLEPLPAAPVETFAGPMTLTDARLAVDRALFELCPDAPTAGPLGWLVGRARAHGGFEHAEGSLTVPLGAALGPDGAAEGSVAVPPDHAICAVVLVPTQPISAELHVSTEAGPEDWPLLVTPIRWPVEPMALDADHRAARWTVIADPARWLDGLAVGGEAPLSVRLADGVRAGFTVHGPTRRDADGG